MRINSYILPDISYLCIAVEEKSLVRSQRIREDTFFLFSNVLVTTLAKDLCRPYSWHLWHISLIDTSKKRVTVVVKFVLFGKQPIKLSNRDLIYRHARYKS